MRSITTSLFAGLLVASTTVSGMELGTFLKSHGGLLKESTGFTNSTIPFAEELGCGACIRGGYDYCIFRQFPDNLTHGMKRNCTDHAIEPEVNSVMNVNETDRWACSGAFLDQENAIINVCGAGDPEHRNPVCGPYLIDITADNRNVNQNISNLPLLSSCTYRVHTTCGYPSISLWSQQNISNEFDIAYTFYNGLSASADINEWDFNSTSDEMGNMNTTSDDEKSLIANVGSGVSDAVFNDCSGDDMNIWVTITRIHANPLPPAPNATLATSRLLQVQDELSTLTLEFTAVQAAQWIRYSFAALAAALALFAF